MRTTLRLTLPLVLIMLGLWLLSGCIYIPTFGRTTGGTNVAKKVGDADSRKPVRVGKSTRDEVVAALGPARIMKPDGSALVYRWTVQNGIAIWPLCFWANSVRGERTLVLRFDDRGLLKSRQVLKENEDLILDLHGPYPPLPDDMQDYDRVQPSTAPATQPVQQAGADE